MTRAGPDGEALARALEDALPQTQCTRCGLPDCASYARAMAAGEAEINRCPPGGAQGIERLAALTGRPVVALDPLYGREGPRLTAVIEEPQCIGCTLCVQACPVDCIVGANKVMHTVLSAQCTGCELCVPVCPVDCIAMTPEGSGATGWAAWGAPLALQARRRYEWHGLRLRRDALERADQLAQGAPPPQEAPSSMASDPKSAVIEAAMARARALRHR